MKLHHVLLAGSVFISGHAFAQATDSDTAPFEFTMDGIKYSSSSGGKGTSATIIGYTDDMPSEVTIPQGVRYEGHDFQINKVAAGAFAGCDKLTTLILPHTDRDGLPLTIGDKAFDTPTLTKIITARQTLPTLTGDPFSVTTYDNGELIVSSELTQEQQDAYRNTAPWSRFFENGHGEVTGLDSVSEENICVTVHDGVIDARSASGLDMIVCTLAGTPVYFGKVRSLSVEHGIYIVKIGTQVLKLAV